MNTTNWLANIFIWQKEVIESAETPFSKLAIFVLPIVAPLVPAFMTGLQLFKLFIKLFTFKYALEISATMAFTIAIVLELLGYVGAITFIRSLFRLIKNEKKDSYWLPVLLNGSAYVFYVAIMWLINFKLGEYFQTASIINSIFGFLSLITIPTGLLAANHLSQKDEDEIEERNNDKKRIERLQKYAIAHGMNPQLVIENDRIKRAAKVNNNQKPASFYQDKMNMFISDVYNNTGSVPNVITIVKKFNLDYNRSKGFVSGLRMRWMKDNNVNQ